MRLRLRLRALVVAALLAAVGAASMLDGEAADFVAGDDGDAFAARRRDEPALSAATAPRPADVCAAPRRAPFLATLDSPGTSPAAIVSRAAASVSADHDRFVASRPLPSRAPPLS